MKIEQITYGVWEAYRLIQGQAELIVVTGIGPRILSLRMAGGPNVLFEDKALGIRNGDWFIYGGHRFWIGPEAHDTYLPDNAPCTVTREGDGLRIAQAPAPFGMQRVLEIGPWEGKDGFTIRHVLRNTGEMLYAGSIWALTCVAPAGKVVAPWSAGSDSWQTNRIQFWRAWAGHDCDVASKQWQLGNETFGIDPTGEEGKVGLYSEEGFFALLRPECTFVKTYRPMIEATYPDGGCNIELYTCGSFIEMETVSPVYTFHPGREYIHTEQWLITDQTYQPADWRKVREKLA